MAEAYRFSTYRLSEGRTETGQLVRFTCGPDDVEQVQETLAIVRDVAFPQTGRVKVPHGGYGQYTRYDITQHKYAGGGHPGDGGWIEVLEIKDPPDERHGVVVNEYTSGEGGYFTEFEMLQQAVEAFNGNWENPKAVERFAKLPGFMRTVQCGLLVPWFYAIGEQELVGDYAFPEHLQQDPVFMFGRKFVVNNENGIPVVRTCMGARVFEQGKESWEREGTKHLRRVVFWEDGSSWRDWITRNGEPRPLLENEAWIAEAMNQFQALLAGRSTEFSIDFLDGSKFVGKLVDPRPNRQTKAGNYYAKVAFNDGTTIEGQFDFEPTTKFPTVQEFLARRLKKGEQIAHLEVALQKTEHRGKKWSGVFYKSPNS